MRLTVCAVFLLLCTVYLTEGAALTQQDVNRYSAICDRPQQNGFLQYFCAIFRFHLSVLTRPWQLANVAPVIQPQASIAVLENTAEGSYVGTVVIKDDDGPQPPTLTVLGGPLVVEGGIKQVQPGVFSADLHLKWALDRETNEKYEVEVSAFDGYRKSTSTITLDVVDVNEAPFFWKSLYKFTTYSNALQSSLIACEKAIDPDTGTFGVLGNYYMQSNDSFVQSHFKVDQRTGCVITTSLLDSVTAETTVRFQVLVRDVAGLSNTTTVEVTIIPVEPVTLLPGQELVPPKIQNNSDFEQIIYFNENDTVVLPCGAYSDVRIPTIRFFWYRDDSPLSLLADGHISMGSEAGVILSQLNAKHEGRYRCFATNRYGRSMGTLYILRMRFVSEFPNIPRQEQVAALGEYYEMECHEPYWSAESRTILWQYKDNSTGDFVDFNFSSRAVPTMRGSIMFREVERSDFPTGRLFRCGLTVGHGIVTWSPGFSVQVRVFVPESGFPRVIYSSDPVVRALEGQSVTLYCIYHGKPIPDQTWTKSNMADASLPERMWNTQYHIPSMSTNDTGLYNCTAINQQGTAHTIIRLALEEKPNFVQGPEDERVSDGNVSFVCQVKGEPQPAARWFINGHPLGTAIVPATQENRVIQRSDSLTIQNVQPKDVMVVGCEAINQYGAIYQEGRLIVFGR